MAGPSRLGVVPVREVARAAVERASFLGALQGSMPPTALNPGIHSWFRGGSLRTDDRNT